MNNYPFYNIHDYKGESLRHKIKRFWFWLHHKTSSELKASDLAQLAKEQGDKSLRSGKQEGE